MVMTTLKDFVDEISEAERIHPRSARLPIKRDVAIHAARYISNQLDANARGGRNAKGKSGPKVKTRTPAAKKNRERVRRYRAKKAALSIGAGETARE